MAVILQTSASVVELESVQLKRMHSPCGVRGVQNQFAERPDFWKHFCSGISQTWMGLVVVVVGVVVVVVFSGVVEVGVVEAPVVVTEAVAVEVAEVLVEVVAVVVEVVAVVVGGGSVVVLELGRPARLGIGPRPEFSERRTPFSGQAQVRSLALSAPLTGLQWASVQVQGWKVV